MNILFYQFLLVIFAVLFLVAGFGENIKLNRYADHFFFVILLMLLFATFTWHL
jgi:hypothetical protein